MNGDEQAVAPFCDRKPLQDEVGINSPPGLGGESAAQETTTAPKITNGPWKARGRIIGCLPCTGYGRDWISRFPLREPKNRARARRSAVAKKTRHSFSP